jgi:hypothetical protein
VAEYVGLAACILGGGMPEELLACITGASLLTEPVVGELMLGPAC